jgi:DNA-binding MarR family transcriptional regulator
MDINCKPSFRTIQSKFLGAWEEREICLPFHDYMRVEEPLIWPSPRRKNRRASPKHHCVPQKARANVIIYRNEDRAYLSWISRQRRGFVLDALRQPTRKRPVMHRANCVAVNRTSSRATHWTTGRHLKACSLSPEELISWAKEEYGGEPAYCRDCAADESTAQEATHHLTKLDREVLNCVLESAVIHLDHGDENYDLTMADLADLLGRSPARINGPVQRLIEQKLLQADDTDSKPSRRRIYPTAAGLRTLSTFEAVSDAALAEELDRLHPHAPEAPTQFVGSASESLSRGK